MAEDRDSAESGEKRKKRRATADTEAIRDRNQRIREEAAAKRREKREGERAKSGPTAQRLDASEIVDDALARTTHVAGNWLKRNVNVVQWAVVLAVGGGIAWQIYAYRRDKNEGKTSDLLMRGVHADLGAVSEDPAVPDPLTGLEARHKPFKNNAERLKAAADGYRAALGESGPPGTLARLGLAGVLYDQGKYQDALKEYGAVRSSELAGKDSDVKGRAIEGIGLSEEALKNLDAAAKAYRELENNAGQGFAPLGLYHQARIAFQKGDKDGAKKFLKSALEKFEKSKDLATPPSYTQAAARELLAIIDPSEAAAAPGGITPEQLQQLAAPDGAPGGTELSKEKLEQMIKEFQKSNPPPPAPEAPAPEAPAPVAPAPVAPTAEAPKAPAAPSPVAPKPKAAAPAAPNPEPPAAPAAPTPAPAASVP